MGDTVKPCPFCGAQPIKERVGLSEVYAYADKVTFRCQECGCARGAIGDHSKGGYADNSTVEDRALEAWNTREPQQSEFRTAYIQWMDRTEWARWPDSKYLGMHRADVIKAEFDRLKAENESLRKDKSEPCDGCFMAEVEALRKDAERFRWTNIEGNWVARMFGKWRAHIGEYGDGSPTEWYSSREEAIDAAIRNSKG